jgi:DNA polymerase III alpha subunit (gram-positive type)
MPSGVGRITRVLKLQDEPIATAEFLVIDTETNGLGGDACEMTEVGAVLVGGGELHDRWDSLVRTLAPLRRGIQRFTGRSLPRRGPATGRAPAARPCDGRSQRPV